MTGVGERERWKNRDASERWALSTFAARKRSKNRCHRAHGVSRSASLHDPVANIGCYTPPYSCPLSVSYFTHTHPQTHSRKLSLRAPSDSTCPRHPLTHKYTRETEICIKQKCVGIIVLLTAHPGLVRSTAHWGGTYMCIYIYIQRGGATARRRLRRGWRASATLRERRLLLLACREDDDLPCLCLRRLQRERRSGGRRWCSVGNEGNCSSGNAISREVRW